MYSRFSVLSKSKHHQNETFTFRSSNNCADTQSRVVCRKLSVFNPISERRRAMNLKVKLTPQLIRTMNYLSKEETVAAHMASLNGI
jgi:hypothetical protein